MSSRENVIKSEVTWNLASVQSSKPGMAAYDCSPNSQETGEGRVCIWGQSGLYHKPVSEIKVEKN